MQHRRAFLGDLARLAAVGPVALPSLPSLPSLRPDAVRRVLEADRIAGGRSPAAVAEDESYWGEIARAFEVDRTLINLNNGGVSPTPGHVMDAMIRDLRFSNEAPTDHMWQILEPRLESVRRDLARDFGCDPEELAITRNASEALETLILGVDLRRGDEVIVTNQNYGRMLTTWDQRARRDGIVVRSVSFGGAPGTDDDIVRRFAEAITPRTKVIEITHITNLTGHILPVRRVVELAKPKGIQVFVDGAHAYAHFPFTRDELGCDYYGTSLHKWLHAPIGTGFLHVRRERIPSIWPLMGASREQVGDIRKYEEIGTHPAANHNAIAAAFAFHAGIGVERKIARLRWLRDRWAKRLPQESDRVKVLTPLDSPRSGALCLFTVEGMEAGKLAGWLRQKHRIITTPIVHPEFTGLRITPSVYTMPHEIDAFVEAVLGGIRQGIA